MEIDYISAIPFNDSAITNFINKNGDDGFCSWTGEKSKCILLSDLTEFIDERIQTEYVEPFKSGAVYDKEKRFYEDRFPGLFVMSSLELLYDLLDDTPHEILLEISGELTEEYWTRKELYTPTLNETYAKSWSEFKYIIKHKVRFMFFEEVGKIGAPSYENYSDPYSILMNFREAILKHNLIVKFPTGDLHVYRSRMHKKQKNQLNHKELGPPPDNCAQANRLSPAGIPMFYCALEEETSIIEVIDINKPDYFISTASFSNLKPLTLIDFSQIEWCSIFDTENVEKRETFILLQQFIEDLIKPISNDGSQHIDYVPTQVVTEFLKKSFKTDLDEEIHGFFYESSKSKGNTNVVLFFNQENITDDKYDSDKYIVMRTYPITKYQINDLNYSVSK